jgi:hypothetical protein
LRFPKILSQRLRATRVPADDVLIDIVERPMHASRVARIATSQRSSFRQGRKKMPPYHSPQGSCYPENCPIQDEPEMKVDFQWTMSLK